MSMSFLKFLRRYSTSEHLFKNIEFWNNVCLSRFGAFWIRDCIFKKNIFENKIKIKLYCKI